MRVDMLCSFEVMLQEANGKEYTLISLTRNLVSRVTGLIYTLLSKNTGVSSLPMHCPLPEHLLYFVRRCYYRQALVIRG